MKHGLFNSGLLESFAAIMQIVGFQLLHQCLNRIIFVVNILSNLKSVLKNRELSLMMIRSTR